MVNWYVQLLTHGLAGGTKCSYCQYGHITINNVFLRLMIHPVVDQPAFLTQLIHHHIASGWYESPVAKKKQLHIGADTRKHMQLHLFNKTCYSPGSHESVNISFEWSSLVMQSAHMRHCRDYQTTICRLQSNWGLSYTAPKCCESFAPIDTCFFLPMACSQGHCRSNFDHHNEVSERKSKIRPIHLNISETQQAPRHVEHHCTTLGADHCCGALNSLVVPEVADAGRLAQWQIYGVDDGNPDEWFNHWWIPWTMNG